jgi:Tfp pilus assembly protein PilO
MKLSRRERVMLVIMFWTVGFYIFYHFAYTPLKNEKIGWAEKNRVLQEEVISARQSEKDLKQLKVQEQLYRDRYTRLARQLPSQEYIPEVVAFMENQAKECGLHLMNINYQEQNAASDQPSGKGSQPDTMADIKSMDFHLTGWGSYYDAVSFVAALEQSERIYSVVEVALAGNEQSSSTLLPGGEVMESGLTEATFNPQEMKLTMRVRTYCGGKAAPGINEVENPVEAVSSQRDNPFIY